MASTIDAHAAIRGRETRRGVCDANPASVSAQLGFEASGHVGAQCGGRAVLNETKGGCGEALPERVGPLQPVEAGEIAIRRAQDEPMFNGESSQVGVRYEVGPAFRLSHEGR